MVKILPVNVGDTVSIPGSERSPGIGNGNPILAFLPGKSHGQRSLVGYSPWGRKESDTTERLHFNTGNQSGLFIGRTDVEAETPILWLPDAKS